LTSLVAVVVGLAAGGIAYASIPDASGVIHGCYNPNGARSTGGSALKIIDSASASCSNGEQSIAWNQAGPKGATGPTGPRGPSDAWDAFKSGVDVPSYGASVAVVSLLLPAGNFFVAAKAAVDGQHAGVTCSLNAPSGTLDSSITVADAFAVIPLQSTVSLTSAGTVSVSCAAENGNEATVDGHIDAVQVATLHP
jgi:hypothetical protein